MERCRLEAGKQGRGLCETLKEALTCSVDMKPSDDVAE